MREIKFRGKRVDNGELVYGQVVTGGRDNKLRYIDINQQELYEVNPKTVGQCTGFEDKNKKKIYAGDIFGKFGGDKERPNEYEFWAKVYFDTDLAAFCVETCSGGWEYLHEYMDKNYCVVIGNIHDNKELFEKHRKES